MKLISAHIENFGKLSDTDINFTDGLNVSLRENGWGKSTLAAFIRAMFYGLEGDGKRDDIQCERKRFAPWQGGAFGGNLTFETKGTAYVITRFFKAKAADDEFELRFKDTNLMSTDFSDKVGEELFHINSESFMRTVFIKQSDCFNATATDDINAKLGNISDGIDLNKYAKADEILKDALNAYSATRKTGEIARLKARMSELKAEVTKGNGIEHSMNVVEDRINASKADMANCNAKLNDLNIKKSKVSKYERKLNLRKQYENLVSEIKDKENAVNERRAYFPVEVPLKDTCDEWEKAVHELKNLESLSEGTRLSAQESALYQSLLATFEKGLPDTETIDSLLKDAGQLSRMNATMAQFRLSENEEERLSGYRESYGDIVEAEEEVSNAIESVNIRAKDLAEADRIKHELSNKDYEYENHKEKTGKSTGLLMLGLILCVIGIGAYMALREFYEAFQPVSFFPLGLGVIFLLVSLIKKNGKGTEGRMLQSEVNNLSEKLEDLNAKINETEDSITELLNAHDKDFNERTLSRDLQSLMAEIYDYKTLENKNRNFLANDCVKDCEAIVKRISEYLSSYNIYSEESDFGAKLTDLKGKLGLFNSLNDKNSNFEAAKRKAEKLSLNLKESLRSYGIDPGLDVYDKVDTVLDILAEYDSLLNLLEDAKGRLKAFEQDNNIAELLSDEDVEEGLSFDEITREEAAVNASLELIRKNLATDKRTLDDYADAYEDWNDNKDELANLETEIKEKTKKLGIIEKTEDLLTKAKEKLTSRYMEPLLKGFTRYYCLLTGEDASDYHIDANTVITKEEKGKQRSTELLSYGYQDLIGICLRLAMADAMYPDEKPVLILDDPFVNLDDKKMAGANVLLKEASKDYQIVYLTCRENRVNA